MIEQVLERRWKSFKSSLDCKAAFPSYVEALLEFQGKGVRSDRLVAGYIARTLFIEEVIDDPVSEAIAQYAGELENPELSATHQAYNWGRIRGLLQELRQA